MIEEWEGIGAAKAVFEELKFAQVLENIRFADSNDKEFTFETLKDEFSVGQDVLKMLGA